MLLFLAAILHVQIKSQITGTIKNQYGLQIPAASIKFINRQDRSKIFKTRTDSSGNFSANFPLMQENTVNKSYFLTPYPNPNYGSVIIPFYKADENRLKIEIYNLIGQKIKTLEVNVKTIGYDQVRWQGQNSSSEPVSAGLYIAVLNNGQYRDYKKLTILSNQQQFINEIDPEKIVQAQTDQIKYDIVINTPSGAYDTISTKTFILNQDYEFVVHIDYSVPFSTSNKYLNIFNGSEYKPFFINGINLGVSIPGTQPGQLAASREQYRRWINRIGEIGINSIRVYTLHYPRFYEELQAYNEANPGDPIYLFQGIWLHEVVPDKNLYNLTQAFDNSIEEVVDCCHGNRTIEQRYGEAYGEYSTDVSTWIMGYILGREIQPVEIITTDSINSSINNYEGKYVNIAKCSPSEAWLAERIDHAIEYEKFNYQTERPLSISSWPTLDPLEHPTESGEYSSEDITSVDLADIDVSRADAGYFASYHAYPYYPDFINQDPNYREFVDKWGSNSYLGYLNDLKEHYNDFPLVIAEYGVPSSWGNAHFSHSGMHHGDHTEIEQGEYNVRLLNNIYDSKCGGGMLFSWINEWFKQAWITNPFSNRINRHLWHNVTSPEQNYGLIKFVEQEPDFQTWSIETSSDNIQRVLADYDSKYFYLSLEVYDFPADDTLWIGFDTYDAELGESILPNGKKIEKRAEFALEITSSDTSYLYVTQAYDLFGIYHYTSSPEQLYRSIPTDNAPWNLVRWKTNRFEDSIHKIGKIKNKLIGQIQTNRDGVRFYEDRTIVRIPWALLQFTAPTKREVIHDDRSTPTRETKISQGIAVTICYKDDILSTQRYKWDTWEKAPKVIPKEKKSLSIFQDGINQLYKRIGLYLQK